MPKASHAVCVRGLKLLLLTALMLIRGSHAVCVRGLKHDLAQYQKDLEASHAVCVRGLKLQMNWQEDVLLNVARRVRAWIETLPQHH